MEHQSLMTRIYPCIDKGYIRVENSRIDTGDTGVYLVQL